MTTPRLAKDKIILPLDVADEAAALRLVEGLAGTVSFFKVGLELFTRCGPRIVDRIREAGGGASQVFLDLKLHDIPNTVAGAVRAAAALEVDFLTVHLAGGAAMLRAAVEAAGEKTLLLGVSVLTSSDAGTLAETGVHGTVEEQVLRLAALGVASGVRGIVASAHEARPLRTQFGPDLTLVVPGVRPAAGASDDQRRVMTPREALAAGADYLVIGRPITAQPAPRAAAEAIVRDLENDV